MARDNIREIGLRMQDAMRRVQKRLPARCLALTDSSRPYPNAPVQTHTLTRSTFLRNLAEGGHVYSYSPLLNRVAPNDPPISIPERRGIKNASTFPGFCRFHDARLFSAVETRPFKNTPEQVFMLAYRSICYELFIKELECHPRMRYVREKYENKLPRSMYDSLSRIRAIQATGTASGLRDLRFHKAAFDVSLASKHFEEVTACTVEISGDPILMCCNDVTPSYDFSGNFLQDMQDDDILGHSIAVTAFTDGPGHWFIVLAWHRESDAIGLRLISSLQQQDDLTSALTSLIFVHCGNLHFRISWWDTLPPVTRQWLMSLWTLTAILPDTSRDLHQRMPLPPWRIKRINFP